MQPTGERILYLTGRVATSDSTKLPHDVLVERVCNGHVRQQIYAATNGSFSMDLSARANTLLDASADGYTRSEIYGKNPELGILKTDLSNCDLRASVSGFRSDSVNLVARDSFSGRMDIGSIVVERVSKVDGTSISALPYKAPKDARKAYEKGMEAQKANNLAVAQQSFEKAVKLYPQYASAWFQLGNVLHRENQSASARSAYVTASGIDNKFLPPYLALSAFAFRANDWDQLLKLTGHILELDPLNYNRVKGYILDLDSFDFGEAYFYHAVACFHLDRIDDAQNSALKAANLDVRPRFPQIHLLLAEIFTRKNEPARAISEFQVYLDQVPHAKNADEVRARLLALQSAHANPLPPAPRTDQE